MEFERILALLIFAFIAAATPGPNNVMLMASGVNFGFRRSLPPILGICIGFPIMILLIGFGFSAVFERFPWLHELIKIVGVLYLVYLAWRIASSQPADTNQQQAKPFTFIQIALYQWLNPKGWVMASSALATFTTLQGDFILQVGIVVAVFFMVAIPSTLIWLLFGVGLQSLLREPRYFRAFNFVMAALLLASVLPVVLELLGI